MHDSVPADAGSRVFEFKARDVFFFGAISLLYVSFGTVLGFVQGGLPPILRAKGLDVATIGQAFLLYLPIGLAFLWAPLIDRYRLPVFTPRVGWIVAMQVVSCFGLLVLARGEAWPLGALFAIGLVVTTAVATMDIALEALIVDAVDESRRPIAAACKIVSFCLGAILGGGVVVAMTDSIGWSGIFYSFAALGVAAVIPVLFLPEHPQAGRERKASVVAQVLRSAGFLKRLGIGCLVFASIVSLFALNRVALTDLGMSLETNGWIVGTLGPLISIAAAVLAAAGVRALGAMPVLLISAAGAIATGLVWAFAAATSDLGLGTGATLAGAAFLAGIYTVLYAAVIRWSVGPASATAYAIFYSVGNLAGLVAAGVASQLIVAIGWPTFYIGATLCFAVVAAVTRHALVAKET